MLGTIRTDSITISLSEIEVEMEHPGSVDAGSETKIFDKVWKTGACLEGIIIATRTFRLAA